MTDKLYLEALTGEAEAAAGAARIEINALPFRVGRESRYKIKNGVMQLLERRKGSGVPNNELYLIDAGRPLNVSREHFEIRHDDGGYYVVDRGSACGTGVATGRIGSHDQGGTHYLSCGDEIVVGTDSSPYIYRFICAQAD